MVSKEQIDELINKIDIVDLVSRYVTLERAGSSFKGLCPFHDEKTPSFMVSPTKKIAKCMGCHTGGNPITFLMQIERIEYPEALRRLADMVGMKLDGLDSNKKVDNFNVFYEIMDTSKQFYIHNLFNTKSGQEALDYLHKRGIDDETIKRFGIGLAPTSSDSLYKVLIEKKYNEIDMINLGLIKNGDKGFYDLFQRRIMFPITDEEGNTIAFSGRIFNSDDKNQPKYVNSPESKIFVKGKTLFNLSNAISSVRKTHRIVLHEGQMDVIAANKAGITDAVCSLGTSLTKNQVNMISRYADEVIVCYDGDSAGVESMMKAIQLFDTTSLKLKLVLLPNGMDPDEFVNKQGPEAFIEYFNNNQQAPLDFILEYATRGKDFSNIDDIESAKKILFTHLALVDSQVSIERYVDKLATKMNVSKSSLMIDFSKYCNISIPQKFDDFSDDYQSFEIIENKPAVYLANYAKAELRLINYAKLGREKALEIESAFDEDNPIINFLEPIHQDLWFKLIDEYYIHNKDFNEGKFLKLLNHNLYNCYVNDLKTLKENMDYIIPYDGIDMANCIKIVIDSQPKKQIDEIDKKFAYLSDDDKKSELLRKIANLKKYNNSKKK